MLGLITTLYNKVCFEKISILFGSNSIVYILQRPVFGITESNLFVFVKAYLCGTCSWWMRGSELWSDRCLIDCLNFLPGDREAGADTLQCSCFEKPDFF